MKFKEVTILDWLHRLLVKYSAGDEALPRELQLIMKRAAITEIRNGKILYIFHSSPEMLNMEAAYQFNISDNDSSIDSWKGTIDCQVGRKTVTIIVTEFVENYVAPFRVIDDNRQITIFVGKNVLEVEDIGLTAYAMISICNMLVKPIFSKGDIAVDYISLIEMAFVRCALNTEGMDLVDLYRSGTKEVAEISSQYLAECVDFSASNTYLLLNDLLDKLISGDADLWTYLAKKARGESEEEAAPEENVEVVEAEVE